MKVNDYYYFIKTYNRERDGPYSWRELCAFRREYLFFEVVEKILIKDWLGSEK